MNETLAVKYRPQTFNEVCSQVSIKKILQRQIELKQFKNVYLFSGPSGTGKTTLARIFANEINMYQGSPIEIDGASNNGVDNVKMIIQSSAERSLDSTYKIYIVDECHMITTAGWNAFLKILEEPPMYTIFMFCTTDAQKIPATIINRVQRFNLTKVNTQEIKNRLRFVCEQEHFINYEESIDYISKISSGGMRDALAMLDKCSGYSSDLSINNVLEALGNYSYQSFFDLTNAIIDGNESIVINLINSFYNSGNDLKLFVEQYLNFVLDLAKYCLFKDLSVTMIPLSMEDKVKYTTGIENNRHYFNNLTDKILNIKNTIRYDSNMKTTIEIMLLQLCR